MSPNILALLPELILTLTGVLVMLAEPMLPATSNRKGLGWLAIVGTIAAGAASWYQLGLGTLHAFSGTIQVDAFSVFFHLLIAAVGQQPRMAGQCLDSLGLLQPQRDSRMDALGQVNQRQ